MELHVLKPCPRWRTLWIIMLSGVHRQIFTSDTQTLLKTCCLSVMMFLLLLLLYRCDPQHPPPEGNHHPPTLYFWRYQHQLPARGLPRWLQGAPARSGKPQGAVGLGSSTLHHCSAAFTQGPGQPEVGAWCWGGSSLPYIIPTISSCMFFYPGNLCTQKYKWNVG